MKILRASHLGMCFGVRDAIALAEREAASGPVTILGDLVHNETVLADLRRQGIAIEPRLEDVRTSTIVITAHGASQRRIAAAHARTGRVLEATCPLVHFAHAQLHRLVREGFHPVIIGLAHHVEVRGLTEDLESFHVVRDEQDVDALPHRPRFGVIAQTTQPLSRAERLVQHLRHRFPESEVRWIDTVCLPTKRRQAAAEDLAQAADVVVVIGGAHSNNTRELVATSRSWCSRVHHVQSADDLRPEWFQPDDIVGITAGTSTPDSLIQQVEARLQAWSAPASGGATELSRATAALSSR